AACRHEGLLFGEPLGPGAVATGACLRLRASLVRKPCPPSAAISAAASPSRIHTPAELGPEWERAFALRRAGEWDTGSVVIGWAAGAVTRGDAAGGTSAAAWAGAGTGAMATTWDLFVAT